MKNKVPLLFVLFLLPIFHLFGAEYVVLPKDKVHEGDYFATGATIEISGTVKGDLYVFGSQISIDGKIEGDVISAGGTINISGEVARNARLGGGQVEINGTIGRNLTIMAGAIQLAPSSRIGGNAVLTGGNIDLEGAVLGSVTATASNVRLSGRVGQKMEAYTGELRLTSRAQIGENLEYTSSTEALIDPSAQIRGKTVYHPSAVKEFFHGKWKKRMVFGFRYLPILMNFLFSFVLGWVLLKLFSQRVKGILLVLDRRPWKAFWTGILVALLLPLAALLLFVTVLGLPIALALVAISLITFYTAKIFPILWISNKAFSRFRVRKNSLWALFLGLIGFFILVQMPFLGSVLSVIATMLGLGAIILGRLPRKKKRRP